jgi:hypothetical protein
MLNFQHGSDCAASRFPHDGCEFASKFQGGSGCMMNSRCAASQFHHDSGSASSQCLHGSGCAASKFHHDSGSASTQFQYGSGCFKNVDGKKSKSSILDGGCSHVTEIKSTELKPEKWKLNNYLYVMKNYFESFGNLVQQLIIDSESDNLPDPVLFLQQLGKCEENLTKAVLVFRKPHALSYQKEAEKQAQKRMWPYGRKQTHTHTHTHTRK